MLLNWDNLFKIGEWCLKYVGFRYEQSQSRMGLFLYVVTSASLILPMVITSYSNQKNFRFIHLILRLPAETTQVHFSKYMKNSQFTVCTNTPNQRV